MKPRASLARLTQEEKDRQEFEKAEEQARRNRLAKDLNEAFASSAGRRALRHIMELCGYQKPSVVADPNSGEVQINSTVYNEARRNLYLTLRKHLRRDILIAVENDGLGEEHDNLFT